jgi:Fe-S cluster assembly scaffold protein SufB
MDVASAAGGIWICIQVERGTRIPRPVHLCFGLFECLGIQNIGLELRLEGEAHARGHVDCLEIVREWAHPLAKVTHEAAIGSVDHGQIETLMSRGVAPE